MNTVNLTTTTNNLIEVNTITPDAFDTSVTNAFVQRFGKVTQDSKANWGKMNVGQMLKHVADNLEMELGDTEFKRLFLGRLIGRMVISKITKNDKPNGKSEPTHPRLVIKGEVNFDQEKERLLQLLNRLSITDPAFFENRVHPFFGKMKSKEWSVWIYKHIDHHLRQFGA